MPALLKGKMKWKVPENAKPGDEVEVEGTFEADQSDYDGSLRARLDQQKRQLEASFEPERKELTELKAKGTPAPQATDTKTTERLQQLERELAQSKLDKKVDEALKKAGLVSIPKVYRDSIRLDPAATDAEVEAAAKALADDPDLKKLTTTPEPETKPAKPGTGGRGGQGSGDPKDKLATLSEKARTNAPQLHKMLLDMGPDEQKDVLESWESQGVLNPPQKK